MLAAWHKFNRLSLLLAFPNAPETRDAAQTTSNSDPQHSQSSQPSTVSRHRRKNTNLFGLTHQRPSLFYLITSCPALSYDTNGLCLCTVLNRSLKADSHTACHAHAVPMPRRSLIHTCHVAPLPCSDSAVSFVKVRMVAGNIRTASPAV